MNKSNKIATIKLAHEEISVTEVAVRADRNVAEFRRRHWTKVLYAFGKIFLHCARVLKFSFRVFPRQDYNRSFRAN